jgi:integrase
LTVSILLAVIMASIHKRPGSGFWWASFRDGEGRQTFRSTKLTDRPKALMFALELERAARLEALTEAQARRILDGMLERVGDGERLRNPSIEEWLREWLVTKETARTSGTAERYRGTIDAFLEHIGTRAKRALTALVTRDVQGFADARLKGEKLSGSTVILDVKILRTALNAARRQGLVPINVAEAVELPEKSSVERGTFTPAEITMLVNTATGEWRTLILCGYFLGARLSDLARLEWSHVDLTAGTVTFMQAKTRKSITIPLHPDLHAHLEELATSDRPEQFIMPGMADKGPGGKHGLSEGFKRIVAKAGLDLQTVKGNGRRNISRRTFHALRHSFTSALANAGVAPELRMKLTGHASDAIHRGYTHHELQTLRDAVARLPKLAK